MRQRRHTPHTSQHLKLTPSSAVSRQPSHPVVFFQNNNGQNRLLSADCFTFCSTRPNNSRPLHGQCIVARYIIH
eukprot:scaffold31704_cov72-Cyclotella_meneghiniana.AAC.8